MQTVTKGFIRNSLSCKELASHCKALQTVVVAQLDRAADCGSAGRMFESCQPQKVNCLLRGVKCLGLKEILSGFPIGH